VIDQERWELMASALADAAATNCTFDRGFLCPTYSKPFDLLVRGNETGDWRGRRDSNPINQVC